MKTIKFYISALLMTLAFAACSPDSFDGANGEIPSLDGVEPVVVVDQNINQVTFSLPSDLKGCMPVWIFYENKGTDKEKIIYSTVNGQKKIFAVAGDYEYEFKLMNRNGMSDGTKTGTFHIDNTIVNFDKYFTQMCGGKENSSKEWRIDNDKQGHLGCGEPNTTGLNWWAAGPNEKKDFGVYDCRLTFTSTGDNTKGGYHFNPGESGQIYANKDVVAFGGPAAEDFCVDATEQDVEFTFDVVGNDIYVVFPEHTYFPYIANDDIWNEPRYKLESITPSEINLVIDNGGIAWHYILTSGANEADPKVILSKYTWYIAKDESAHMGCGPTGTIGTEWWSASANEKSGNGIYDDTLVFSENGEFTYNPGEDGKMFCNKDVTAFGGPVDADYDADVQVQKSTWVLEGYTPGLDGDMFLVFPEHQQFPYLANDDMYNNPRYRVMEITADRLVLCADNGSIAWQLIFTHDGTGSGDDDNNVEWRDADNLWNVANASVSEIYIGDASWAPYPADQSSASIDADGKIKFTITPATEGQWKSQLKINTGITKLDPEKTYDFHCVMNGNADMGSVTVKLCELGPNDTPGSLGINYDANTVLYDNSTKLTAYDNVEVSFVNKPGITLQDNPLMIVFDFGGNPADFDVEISDIHIQEHVGPKTIDWDANSDSNLWKTANPTLSEVYHADGGWAPYPAGSYTCDVTKDKVTFHMNQSTASQWQAQVKIDTGIKKLDPNKKYHFRCNFNANNDLNNVTVKLCELGPNDTPGSLGIKYDSNTVLYDNSTNLTAYTDCVFQSINNNGITLQDNPLMIVFDFGGSPENFDVEITDIILLEE